MNYASNDQLIAVAQSCNDFEGENIKMGHFSAAAEEISCELCNHWNGKKCEINVFDKVLTSLDQE